MGRSTSTWAAVAAVFPQCPFVHLPLLFSESACTASQQLALRHPEAHDSET